MLGASRLSDPDGHSGSITTAISSELCKQRWLLWSSSSLHPGLLTESFNQYAQWQNPCCLVAIKLCRGMCNDCIYFSDFDKSSRRRNRPSRQASLLWSDYLDDDPFRVVQYPGGPPLLIVSTETFSISYRELICRVADWICPDIRANEMHAVYCRHHNVSPYPNPHLNTNNSVKQV